MSKANGRPMKAEKLQRIRLVEAPGPRTPRQWGPEDFAAVDSICNELGIVLTGKASHHGMPALSIVAVRLLKQMGVSVGQFADLMWLNWPKISAGPAAEAPKPAPPPVQ